MYTQRWDKHKVIPVRVPVWQKGPVEAVSSCSLRSEAPCLAVHSAGVSPRPPSVLWEQPSSSVLMGPGRAIGKVRRCPSLSLAPSEGLAFRLTQPSSHQCALGSEASWRIRQSEVVLSRLVAVQFPPAVNCSRLVCV